MKCPNCRCEVLSTQSVCPYCGFDIYAYIRGLKKNISSATPQGNRASNPYQNSDRFTDTASVNTNFVKTNVVPQPGENASGNVFQGRGGAKSNTEGGDVDVRPKPQNRRRESATDYYLRMLTNMKAVDIGCKILIVILLLVMLFKI